MTDLQDVLDTIQNEYTEMPQLRINARQARRLWNLEPDVCETALGRLVESRFLQHAADGTYVRLGVSAGAPA